MSLIELYRREIRISGRLLRIGKLEADGFHFLNDPRQMLTALKDCGQRLDLFTFVQQMPETKPNYSYPMEWDNFAVLPISTFDH